MHSKKDFNVLKHCIDFIQQRKRDITNGDSPFSEGDKEISYSIAEERIFPIPFCECCENIGMNINP